MYREFKNMCTRTFDYVLKLNSVFFSAFLAEYSLLEHIMFVEKILNAEKQHI
jgi:hypothetical protein